MDHGISKSLVGGAFKPASALTRSERRLVGGYKQARGVSPEHQKFKQESALRHRELKDRPAETTRVNPFMSPSEPFKGVTYRLGSAKRGRSVVQAEANSPKTLKTVLTHERAHASPKRSEYRLHGQILGSPAKTMREEARADMANKAGHYKHVKRKIATTGRAQGSVYQVSAATGDPSHIRRAYPHMSMGQAKKATKDYRKVQDKIAGGRGEKPPELLSRRQKQVAAGVTTVTGLTAAGGLAHHYYRKPKKTNG